MRAVVPAPLLSLLVVLTCGACDLLLTEPTPRPTEIAVAFQVVGDPLGGEAVAFSRVRRIALRFTQSDGSSRDTVITTLPVEGVIRAGVAVAASEHGAPLGVSARLGFDDVDLFRGQTTVQVAAGSPTTVEVTLTPVPASVLADRERLTLVGVGSTGQVDAATLFASGDTIRALAVAWSSEDPGVALVSPTGRVFAGAEGQTRLEARLDQLADTVLVEVLPVVTSGGRVEWANEAGGVWSVGANWSTGSPPSPGDSAIIALDGTYTVTLDAAPPALAALRIGGVSGSQTLASTAGSLAALEDVTIEATGTVDLSGTTLSAATVRISQGGSLLLHHASTVDAAVVNAGTVRGDGLAGVTGAVTTTPTSSIVLGDDVLATNFNIAQGFTNNGSLQMGGSTQLAIPAGTLVNAAGGQIDVVPTALGGNTQLTAALDNRGSVTALRLLDLNATGALHANSGTITATGGALVFVTGADAFDNTGSLDASDGSFFVELTGVGAGFTTSGSITVGNASQLEVRNGPFVQTGGSISGTGVFRLAELTASASDAMTLGVNGPTFLQLVGSTLTAPGVSVPLGSSLLLDGGTLLAPVDLEGQLAALRTSRLGGALSTTAGSQIVIEGGSGGAASLTVDTGFTNSSSILLMNSFAGADAALVVTSGAVVNEIDGGISSIEGAGGGARTIAAGFDNRGRVEVWRRLEILTAGAPVSNSGVMQTNTTDSLIVTGSSDFQNTGTLNAGEGAVSVTLAGGGATLTNTGTLIAFNAPLVVANGAFEHLGGSIGGPAEVVLRGVQAALAAEMTLGTTGPSNLRLEGSTLTAPGLSTAVGTTLTLLGSTLDAPLGNAGRLAVLQSTSTLNGAVTSVAGSSIVVAGGPDQPAMLQIASGFTNNGLLDVTGDGTADATLRIEAGTLVNGVSGTIASSAAGGPGGVRTIVGNVSQVGTIDIDAPLTIQGQLVDPPGAPSTYLGNGAALSVAGLDVDGAVFDDMPLVSVGGSLATFANNVFQNMDPGAIQLTVEHPGGPLVTFFSLSFATTPTGSGRYIRLVDTDPALPALTVEVLTSSPTSGVALSDVVNGAVLVW